MKKKKLLSILALAGISAATFALSFNGAKKHNAALGPGTETFKLDLARALKSVQIANANAANGDTAAQTMQLFGRLLMGFPDADSYNSAVSGGSPVLQAMFGQDGLAGRISGTRDIIVAMAKSAGITSCAAAPDSGDLTADGITLTWGTPSNSAPASYPKTGVYDKKISYVGADGDISTTASFEFFCDYSGMMMKVTDTISGTAYLKYAIYYDRGDENDFRMDFYMWGKDSLMGSEDIKMALQLKYNASTNVSKLYVTRTGSSVDQSTKCLGYRYVATIDLSTNKLSLYTAELGTGNGASMSCATFHANSLATSAVVSSSRNPSQGSSDNDYQGCFDTFDTNPTSVTSATTCSGLDLASPDAPGIDSNGSWSLDWMQSNLKSKVEAL